MSPRVLSPSGWFSNFEKFQPVGQRSIDRRCTPKSSVCRVYAVFTTDTSGGTQRSDRPRSLESSNRRTSFENPHRFSGLHHGPYPASSLSLEQGKSPLPTRVPFPPPPRPSPGPCTFTSGSTSTAEVADLARIRRVAGVAPARGTRDAAAWRCCRKEAALSLPRARAQRSSPSPRAPLGRHPPPTPRKVP